MPSRGLDPDTALSIHLSAICSRNRYTKDPGSVVAELYEVAGERIDLLARVVGSWIGYYESPETRRLIDALRALPLDLEAGLSEGRNRRNARTHSTRGYLRPGH